jgi:hypothetical protein
MDYGALLVILQSEPDLELLAFGLCETNIGKTVPLPFANVTGLLFSRLRHYLRGGRGSMPAMVLKALTTSVSRGSSVTSFCWSSGVSGVG